MDNLIQRQIAVLRNKVGEFEKENDEKLSKLMEELNDFGPIMTKYKDYWVGAWYEENFNVYKDLSNQSNNNFKYDNDWITNYFSNLSGLNIVQLTEITRTICKSAKELNGQIVTELSIIKESPKFNNQIELLDKMEKYKWGVSKNQIIDKVRPKGGLMSMERLSRSMGSHFNIPPHINFYAGIIQLISVVESVQAYSKNAKRLLRELELRLDINITTDPDALNTIDRIASKFHQVVMQLKNRYDNRSTINTY